MDHWYHGNKFTTYLAIGWNKRNILLSLLRNRREMRGKNYFPPHLRVDSHGSGHLSVGVFPRLYPRGRVDVDCVLESLRLTPTHTHTHTHTHTQLLTLIKKMTP